MDKNYQIDTEENRAFMKEMCQELLDFGRQFPSPGGSAYYLNEMGLPWKDRNRETWITCRMIHSYCLGALLGYKDCRDLAIQGLKGLQGELKDREHGGWYPGLTPQGVPLSGKKCYEHAFVILGASSGILAECPGAEELLEEALQVFDRYFWQEEEGLACDTWNTEFTLRDPYRGINANMHTVEAFLAVADVTGREKYRERAGRIIRHVGRWAEENDWRLPEHFTQDWVPDYEYHRECPDDPFKPYGATPGHGIEWARLILQWALSSDCSTSGASDDLGREDWVATAEHLYERAIRDGWYGDGKAGIVYTTDWSGKPIVRDRMHWTLAEAINTAALLYRVTAKQTYADQYGAFMEYLDQYVLDRSCGSWLPQLDENNELTDTVWPGKPDIYHALQATLIPYLEPKWSVGRAVKEFSPLWKCLV